MARITTAYLLITTVVVVAAAAAKHLNGDLECSKYITFFILVIYEE